MLGEWRGEPGPATVYVRLLDTSRMDAPSRIVAQAVMRDVRLDQAQDEGIAFEIGTEEADPRTRYEVSALIDLDGDGQTSVGDYVTTASYPVLTRGYPDQVQIRVCPVGGGP